MWMNSEQLIKQQKRAHKRVKKTLDMRDKHNKGEITTEEYINYLQGDGNGRQINI